MAVDGHGDAVEFDAAIVAFLDQLANQRRASAHTLKAYRRELSALQQRADAHDGLAAISPDQLRTWLADAHRRGLAPRSVARRLAAWRSLFAWMVARRLIKANPAAGLRPPKAPRRLPQVLDVDEAQQLVEVEDDDSRGRRDRAMLELFYSSGLRLSELCGLHWRDVDLRDRLARVRGKGDKVRVVPIGGAACEALQRLAEDGCAPAQPVFTGRGGKAIAARTVQQRLRVLAQRQGVWKRVHPHLLRHSCASHLLESSGEIRAVQELLGHADIGTTQVYTHLDFQHLAKVYDGAHPRAKRRKD
ncbi:MAG: tyrosine recombinase XerC [Xanthomonadales bacterium]|nr:tyrosine recombinase XerC [Xanthomonadales bacterium]